MGTVPFRVHPTCAASYVYIHPQPNTITQNFSSSEFAMTNAHNWLASFLNSAALRRDHCSNPASTPTGPHEEGRFHMMAKLKRVRPKNRLLSALEEKMVAKIGVDTRAADEARAKATALKKSVGEEEKRLTQEAASAQAAVKPSQSLGDQLPAGAKASPTLEDSVSTLPDANSVGSESAGTPVAAATTAYTPPGPATVATGSVVAEQQPMKHLTSNELVMASSGSVCNESSQNERLSLVRHLSIHIRLSSLKAHFIGNFTDTKTNLKHFWSDMVDTARLTDRHPRTDQSSDTGRWREGVQGAVFRSSGAVA